VSPRTRERRRVGSGGALNKVIRDDNQHVDLTGSPSSTSSCTRNEAEQLTEQIRVALSDLDRLCEFGQARGVNIDDLLVEIIRDVTAVARPEVVADSIPATATCPCGVPIGGFRSDSRFCSNACRQRAYRQRKAVS
jgi:hypothetical protein